MLFCLHLFAFEFAAFYVFVLSAVPSRWRKNKMAAMDVLVLAL